MWSHPSDADAKTLAAAGLRGVIAFNSRERYFDPNQVVYSSGPYGRHDPLEVGFCVSWRQWSELLEDLQLGKKIVVRGRARVEKYPNKFDTVYSWIPGTEPEGKGVILTAHLFDGYVKRGANDNMSGCVIELEILRTLNHLIATGQLPRPRRTIHFLWPQEISGTYAFFKEHPGFTDPLSVNLNLDMVGEGLRHNNAAVRMYQCPGHLPSYLDGLARSLLNYVWRTNDVVFGDDGPRGRPGGQYFPIPLVEKNGSLDAFRFSIHPSAGGTDHVCFINPSVAVPGISFITWPDQWYHADTDTPDKSDPTQLKRVAFIGAACAWAAAQCTDDVAGSLAEVVSDYGYLRVAERELPLALARVDAAEAKNLAAETEQALRLVTLRRHAGSWCPADHRGHLFRLRRRQADRRGQGAAMGTVPECASHAGPGIREGSRGPAERGGSAGISTGRTAAEVPADDACHRRFAERPRVQSAGQREVQPVLEGTSRSPEDARHHACPGGHDSELRQRPEVRRPDRCLCSRSAG